jgi:hypothetical protein
LLVVPWVAAALMRETGDTRPRQGFGIGVLICVLAGIFSPTLNFNLALRR